MHLPRLLRQFIATAVAVLFLACQGMAITYSAPRDGHPADAQFTPESCHETGKSAQISTCQANCESQIASSSASITSLLAAADLPFITIAIDRIAVVADSAPLAEFPLLRVEPPPLRILNCCLRN
jgi:hypothetical protein